MPIFHISPTCGIRTLGQLAARAEFLEALGAKLCSEGSELELIVYRSLSVGVNSISSIKTAFRDRLKLEK